MQGNNELILYGNKADFNYLNVLYVWGFDSDVLFEQGRSRCQGEGSRLSPHKEGGHLTSDQYLPCQRGSKVLEGLSLRQAEWKVGQRRHYSVRVSTPSREYVYNQQYPPPPCTHVYLKLLLCNYLTDHRICV